MGIVSKKITLTDKQDVWIQAQIDTGRYTDDSEYIQELISLEQTRCGEVEAIRVALVEGEASGEPQPFDGIAFKKKMLATHG